jgi:hypothetical protein
MAGGPEKAGKLCAVLPLKAYPPEFDHELGREVLAANPSDLWPVFVRDAIALRDAVRACRSIVQ